MEKVIYHSYDYDHALGDHIIIERDGVAMLGVVERVTCSQNLRGVAPRYEPYHTSEITLNIIKTEDIK